MSTDELLAMYDRALADCKAFVAASADTDLRSSTPCADWDLGGLLAHLVGQNEGFALAVRVGDADISAYDERPVTPASAVPDWSGSAQRVLEAFRAAEAEQQVRIAGFGTFGVEVALRMQLLDTIVHTWDVATALGQRYRPADDLVEFAASYAARIASRYPDGQPGVFAPPLDGDTGDAWVAALRRLGRDAA